MNKLNKNIFKRYVSNCFSLEDEHYVTKQFNDQDSLHAVEETLREEWKNTKAQKQDKDLKPVLERIHQHIVFEPKPGKIIRLYRYYARVAAVLLLPLTLFVVLQYFNTKVPVRHEAMTIIQAPNGANVKYTLPDGTQGWLKGGSELKYVSAFTERHVMLQGEGYFDVTHDAARPFQVHGKESKIVVLGTKFSAVMWPCNQTTEVVLESGKVEFVMQEESTILAPGQRLVYHRLSKNIKVEQVNTQAFNAWVEGLLVFRGENLKEVANKLSQWFNVDVVLEGDYPKDYQFRATFKDESIDEVLRLMKMTTPISYQIIERQKLKDNTYSKTKVILKMNKK